MNGVEMEIFGKKFIKDTLQEIKLDIQNARESAKISFEKAGIENTDFKKGRIQGLEEAENIIKKSLEKVGTQTYHLFLSKNDFKPEGIEHLWRNLALEDDKKNYLERIFLSIVGVEVYLKFPNHEETLVCITSEDGKLKVIGKVNME